MSKKTHIVKVWNTFGKERYLQKVWLNYYQVKYPSDATRLTEDEAKQVAVKQGGEAVSLEQLSIKR
jgi:hypothetical protein